MKYFLIRNYNDKFIVEAETAIVAVNIWAEIIDKEIKEDYNSKRNFRPSEFTVEEIGTHHGIIKASQ